jgi:hypothetical protein
MRFEEHCKRCEEVLGRPYKQVHIWLDEFAKQDIVNHRMYRHNWKGIRQVAEMWGDGAARAAELHIKDDFGGFIPTRDWYIKNWVSAGIIVPQIDE